jgi:hypothetical protein
MSSFAAGASYRVFAAQGGQVVVVSRSVCQMQEAGASAVGRGTRCWLRAPQWADPFKASVMCWKQFKNAREVLAKQKSQLAFPKEAVRD